MTDYFNTGLKSLKKWKEANWSQYQLAAWYGWNKGNWRSVKNILLHRNCPQAIRDKYINSKIWYQRIPALLCKHVRHKYWSVAASDPHPLVRRCAYNGHCWGMKEGYQILLTDVLDLIEQDLQIQKGIRYKELVDRYKKAKHQSREDFLREISIDLTSSWEKDRKIAKSLYGIVSDTTDEKWREKLIETWVCK